MAFWKIKFDKKRINSFKDVCMFMLTKSVNTYIKFIAGFMTVATACRIDERKFVGFSFEYNSRPFEESSWTLVEEGKEFVGMYRLLLYWLSGLSSSVSSFVCKLVSCVYGSLTLCYFYPTGGSKNRSKNFGA